MSDQINGQVSILQRPTTNDPEAWKAYWEAQGWPWRIEPEIDTERQKYLTERRAIVPNIEKSIYPFKDIQPKLTRADVEWLLVTHENGRGPIDWNDESQRERNGLDLRGADLCHVDLSNLPLACMRGGINVSWYRTDITDRYHEIIAGSIEEFNLDEIYKEETESRKMDIFKGAWAAVRMEETDLAYAKLQGALLNGAQLGGANLSSARLEESQIFCVWLKGADLDFAHLEKVGLYHSEAEGATLYKANLIDTDCFGTNFKNANFREAQLMRTRLNSTSLMGTNFSGAILERTTLEDVVLSDEKGIGPQLVDVQWVNVNLTVFKWSQVNMLGEEYKARKSKGERKSMYERMEEYETAVRANRQLAVTLSSQGLNEDAARLIYRAQVLQKLALWFQMCDQSKFRQRIQTFGQYLFSIFLDLLAGYGYRPGRSVIWYLVTIFGFALAYFAIGHLPFFPDAFVFSLTSFHGRGFFPGLGSENSLHNPLVILAAFEAVIGLLIEISFIATFTQRFFGR